MVNAEIIRKYVHQEIEGQSRLVIWLHYRDKKLLGEEKYAEFVGAILKRSKKSYMVMVLLCLIYMLLGILNIAAPALEWSFPAYGLIWIFLGTVILLITTKEYYKIRGSMLLLQKLVHGFGDVHDPVSTEHQTEESGIHKNPSVAAPC
jgi:uncharacterized ion transporter superfamily protein YfcC